jgi:hypothetical protein
MIGPKLRGLGLGSRTGRRLLAASPEYGNITVIQQPAAEFATPEPMDLVFTSQNYHDYPDKFMGNVDP